MSLYNDYAARMLVSQHQTTLLAEAAEARLAKVAQEGRPTFWQRLLNRRPAPARRSRPVVSFRVHHSTGH